MFNGLVVKLIIIINKKTTRFDLNVVKISNQCRRKLQTNPQHIIRFYSHKSWNN